MSNQAVGAVYQTIIDEVINSSRVDFEESGVEEGVLEELRQGWQKKLSQLDVARFPWDPKPDAAAPAPAAGPQQLTATAQPTTQAHFTPNLSLPGNGIVAGTGSAGASVQNGIKTEPGLTNQELAIKKEPGMDDKNSVAASRAAQQLQLQYGNRAAGSINAIQDRLGQAPPPNQASQPLPPGQQQHGGPSIGNGQTDGPGDDESDYEGILVQRTAQGNLHELGRVEIDHMLHHHIAARAKAMEGGGLMVPLRKASARTGLARPARRVEDRRIPAHDGGDDDDDDDDDIDDEDAINSDLDDSNDDNEDDEVDDEGLGHIMLCMYDKVQRVKNKWKCTLKDGVLTVNGKEYIFHKATGEYEW